MSKIYRKVLCSYNGSISLKDYSEKTIGFYKGDSIINIDNLHWSSYHDRVRIEEISMDSYQSLKDDAVEQQIEELEKPKDE